MAYLAKHARKPGSWWGLCGLLTTLLIIPLYTSAQKTITGALTDQEKEPIPYANVLVVAALDSSFLSGTTTDELGAFTLEITQAAQVYLHVASLGYEERYIPIQRERKHYAITLNTSSLDLEAVTISAQKTLYELKPDRMVMNVSAVPSLSGNTALQVLQKAPGVLVDQQNNQISLTARGTVTIMINERIQRMPVSALMARLSGMNAEQIERIEIIHQPPAKYDVAGSGGIINIVLKKRAGNGINATARLMAGYGQREKLGGGFDLNARFGTLNLYANYGYNMDRHDRYMVNHYRAYDYQGVDYSYENRLVMQDRKLTSHSTNIGLDIDLPNRGIFGVLVSYSNNTDEMIRMNSLSTAFEDDQIVDNTRFLLNGLTRTTTLISNANWKQPLGNTSEINLNLDYADIDFYNGSQARNGPGGPMRTITSSRNTPIRIWTAQADFTQKEVLNGQLEAGIKGTFSDIQSIATIQDLQNPEFPGLQFAGEDQIDEQILAAYLSYQKEFSPKWRGSAGLRFENYTYDLSANVESNDLYQEFSNVFPVIRLQYDIDSLNTWQLSFNRSMNRPSFWMLSGYFIFLDPTILAASNPRLRPAFTNNYRLSFQHRSVLTALMYSRSQNSIFFLNTVDKENHLQTSIPSNLDHSESIEISLSTPIRPYHWWENTITLSALHQWVRDVAGRTLTYTDQITTYTAQFNSTFTLGRGWSFNIDGRYMSDFLFGDQVQYLYPYLNAGIQKQFDTGSTLSLSFQDITNSMGRIYWSYYQPELGIRTYGDNNWSERQLRLTYQHSFGNHQIRAKRERDTAQEVRSRL